MGEGGGRADLVDPALDEGQRRLQAVERGLLAGRRLRAEHAAGQRRLQGGGIGRVDGADGLLELLGVDGDAAGVRLHGPEQVRAQPRHVGHQPCRRGLAQREEEPELLVGHLEALAERGDVARQQHGHRGGEQRQPDVGRAEHLAGERADGLADLEPEHRLAQPVDHVGDVEPEPLAAHLLADGRPRVRHVGSVASTHSARLHARPAAPEGATSVTASSHSSATENASATVRRSIAPTEGSPPALACWRASSWAISQLTPPSPPAATRRCTCAAIWRRDSGSVGMPGIAGSCDGSNPPSFSCWITSSAAGPSIERSSCSQPADAGSKGDSALMANSSRSVRPR